MYHLLLVAVCTAAPLDDAKADRDRLPPHAQKYARYLLAEDDQTAQVVSFVVNSVSSRSVITLPSRVGNRLIRLDLDLYGIDPTVYDGLGNPYGDDTLVLRADYFIVKVMSPPAYYRFLGVRNYDGFRKLARVFPANKYATLAGVVSDSTLARSSRLVTREATATGALWTAHDSRQSGRDYLQNLLGDKYDQRATLATLPNYLQAYAADNAAGQLLDSLDVAIAVDTIFDGPVTVPFSCVGCHREGVHNFRDVVRQLNAAKVEVRSISSEGAERLRTLYSGKLPFNSDQRHYAAAVHLATGLTPALNAAAFVRTIKKYREPISLTTAAQELDVDLNIFKAKLSSCREPNLLQWFADQDRTIPRERWEQLFKIAGQL